MTEMWIIAGLGALLVLAMARSAIIAFWPRSNAGRFCEFELGVLDRGGERTGDGSFCGSSDGGDGGGE